MKMILSLLALVPAVAMARADIDMSDFDGSTSHWAMLAGLGIYGTIACHSHPDLVEEYSGTVNTILKWVLRVGLVLVAVSVASGFVGYFFSLDLGAMVLGTWGALKTAQGIYISGVAKGKGLNN